MSQKHVVLFVSDQHRADVVGALGDPFVRTPHLDRLVQDGTCHRRAYCNSPVCGPSRMSFLTSRMPLRNGVLDNRSALPSHLPTLAHGMAAAGYQTVLCGRMHFIGPDQRHGFQERLVGDIGPTEPEFREAPQGPFDGTTGQHRNTLSVSGAGLAPAGIYDHLVVDAARQRLHQQPPDQPLFLVVGTYAPHNPYVCPDELFKHYRKVLPPVSGEAMEAFRENSHPLTKSWLKSRGMDEVTAEEIEHSRAAYYGMVENMDTEIGRLLEAIDDSLGRENTLFMYLSDHGDMAGAKGMFWKSNFFEESVRVPWICAGADVPPGRQLSSPVSLLDLAPTILDWAGAPPLPLAEGISLVPFWSNGQEPPSRPVVSVLIDPRSGPSAMVLQDDFKLIIAPSLHPPRLYHLSSNPREEGEGIPLAADEERVRLLQAAGPSLEDFDLMTRQAAEGKQLQAFWSHQAKNSAAQPFEQWRVDLDSLRCRTDLPSPVGKTSS